MLDITSVKFLDQVSPWPNSLRDVAYISLVHMSSSANPASLISGIKSPPSPTQHLFLSIAVFARLYQPKP